MKKLILAICFLALLVPGFYGYTQSQSQDTKMRAKPDSESVQRMKAAVRKYEPKPGQKFDLTAEGREVVDANGCGVAACKCEGGKACLDLIDSGKCKSNFHCVGPPPLCICER